MTVELLFEAIGGMEDSLLETRPSEIPENQGKLLPFQGHESKKTAQPKQLMAIAASLLLVVGLVFAVRAVSSLRMGSSNSADKYVMSTTATAEAGEAIEEVAEETSEDYQGADRWDLAMMESRAEDSTEGDGTLGAAYGEADTTTEAGTAAASMKLLEILASNTAIHVADSETSEGVPISEADRQRVAAWTEEAIRNSIEEESSTEMAGSMENDAQLILYVNYMQPEGDILGLLYEDRTLIFVGFETMPIRLTEEEYQEILRISGAT